MTVVDAECWDFVSKAFVPLEVAVIVATVGALLDGDTRRFVTHRFIVEEYLTELNGKHIPDYKFNLRPKIGQSRILPLAQTTVELQNLFDGLRADGANVHLLGHALSADEKILNEVFGVEPTFDLTCDTVHLDQLARGMIYGRTARSLVKLCRAWKVDHRGVKFHNAGEDTFYTTAVASKMMGAVQRNMGKRERFLIPPTDGADDESDTEDDDEEE